MRCKKLTVFILFISGFYNLYAKNPPVVKNFINHTDWNFVENKGQIADKGIAYYGHQGGVYLYCKPGMISFVFTKADKDAEQISEATGQPSGTYSPLKRGPGGFSPMKNQPSKITTCRSDLVLLHSNPASQIIASDRQEYYENFYTTGNADSGITNVHTYKTITYKDIYPRIDMVLQAKPNGVEYSFVIYPGGKVGDIQMEWVGIEGIIRRDAYGKTLKDSKIEYSCALGKMEESAPYSFVGADPRVRPLAEDRADTRGRPGYAQGIEQRADTRVRPYTASQKIESQFVLKNNQVGFKVGGYDRTKTLVIDPPLVWGTYFGGSDGSESGSGVATDALNNVYIAGVTFSTIGIATSGAYQTSFGTQGYGNTYLAKFNSDGTIQWSTYYGSSSQGVGVATDTYGKIYLAGSTSSQSGMATSGAYRTFNYSGNSNYNNDVFLAKFNNYGELEWGTYYGGRENDGGTGVTTDASGNVYIVGGTESDSGISTSGAFRTTYSGNEDAFLAKFNSAGTIQWATYYGGAEWDRSNGVAIDDSGNVCIVGFTQSRYDIATSGAHQSSYQGSEDAFLAKFNINGLIRWATYYGGHNNDEANGIIIDSARNIYITGMTISNSEIATAGAYQTFLGGGGDAFLAKFNPEGSIQWATYYGGEGNDGGQGVAVDFFGNICITGGTVSTTGIATNGAYQTSSGNEDAFLAKFSDNGARQWGTYYGGNNYDGGSAVAIDGFGNVYITGQTNSSSGIATINAFKTFLGYGGDAFLAKFGGPDAGIDSFYSPVGSVCTNPLPVVVRLKNFGIVRLDSVQINLSINGILQPVDHWKGYLSPDSSVKVNLGKFLFPIGTDKIKCWTSRPDGTKDIAPENDTSVITINLIPPPVVHPGSDKTICEHSPVSLGAPGINGETYSWTSNPSGFTSTLSNPTVTPLQTTTYYLTVTVTATGCSNTDSVVITVIPAPFAFADLHRSVCKGDSAAIGGPAINGYLYNWTSSPSGFSSSISNPTVAPGNSTQYNLSVTDTITGCTNTASVLVTVNPLPVANVGQSVFQICTGARVKLGGNAIPDMVYSWTSNPTGFASSISDPVVMPLANTWYYLIIRDTATNCSNRDSTSVILSVSQAPVADAGVNQTICAGDSVPIGSHGVSGNTYSWVSHPAGFKSAFPVPVVKPDTTTSYFLTVTNAAGCINFDSTIITVNPKPKLKPGMSQITCGDVVIQLGAPPDSGISYLWRSDPAGFSSTVSNPVDSPKVTTTYHLKETVNATGCADSDSVTVTIVPLPSLGFTITHVNGFEYLFALKLPGYPAYMYHWNFGSSTGSDTSDTAHGYSVNHTYSKNGKYIVTVTFQLPGFCMENDTESVIVNEQFSLNIFPNPFPTQTDINYTLASPAHVKISLTDEIGQQLGTLLDKQLTQGVYNTYFDARLWGLRPAMYFILFQLDDKLYVRKIIQLENR